MKVIVFGATGMVGQGVVRACLADPSVTEILAVTRGTLGIADPKLHEVVRADVSDLSDLEDHLAAFDACFFCLGVSAAGMDEAAYRRVTYDLTLSVARRFAAANPKMTFIYVSGAGTDSSGKGRTMWARVKGQTENAILELPFRSAYMFRPGFIQPLGGIVSKTKLYRVVYAVFAPLYPLLRRVIPKYVTTTENVGRAMLRVAREGAPSPIVENDAIDRLGTPV